jgi:hypothetical protein
MEGSGSGWGGRVGHKTSLFAETGLLRFRIKPCFSQRITVGLRRKYEGLTGGYCAAPALLVGAVGGEEVRQYGPMTGCPHS